METQEKSLTELNEAIAQNPKDVEAYLCRARYYYNKEGDSAKSLADIDKILELDKTCIDAYLLKSEIEEDQGKFDEAIATITDAINVDENFAIAYLTRAGLYEKTNRHQESCIDESKYNEIVRYADEDEEEEDDDEDEETIEDFRADEVSLEQMEKYVNDGVIEDLIDENYDQIKKKLTQIAARMEESNPLAIDLYLTIAETHAHLKMYEEAFEELDKSFQISSELKMTDDYDYSRRAHIYEILQQYHRAEDDYTTEIERAQKEGFYQARAYSDRGAFYLRRSKSEKAINDFTKAIEYDPSHYKYYYHRAECHQRLGEVLDAISDFEQVRRVAAEYNDEGTKPYSERATDNIKRLTAKYKIGATDNSFLGKIKNFFK